MNIKQRLTLLVLPVAMLLTNISYAVTLPALDIQDLNDDSGIFLSSTSFTVDATAFSIATAGSDIDIPDVIFTLTSTGSFDDVSGTGLFSGTFSAGSLLSGAFVDLTVNTFTSTSGEFFGDVTYTGGSMMGNLTAGSIDGIFTGTSVVAKLGELTVVPVPAAVWLFGSGLLGLAGVARRKA
ncbi:MAG: VPLPA-CTERM sorting domain-containing protein [Gammaproteobacteria bacterium]|nr:VPLPA-CTERM sorting domain-containing protein [Gammaproteobacteria bacterium]